MSIERGENLSNQPHPWQFDYQGLTIKVLNFFTDIPSGIPKNATLGGMNFTPGGQEKLNHEYLTANLLIGLEGLQAFFEEIDNDPNKLKPEYLAGRTNKRMAFAIRRLGFTTNEIGNDNYEVIGKTSVVRKRLKELADTRDKQGYNVIDRLQERLEASSTPFK